MEKKYKFQLNGWELILKMNIPTQEINNEVIKLNISIIGYDFEDKPSILNLETRVLICSERFYIKPYDENKERKYMENFKVPKEIVKQIKSYLN